MIYNSYDDLFQVVLTAAQNASPDHQIVVGDFTYMKLAGLASGLWGLYRQIDWTRDQIWPDTADSDNVIHHGGELGLSLQSGEDVSGLLARILARLRTPAAGGNKVDFEQWAAAVPTGSELISSIKCYPSGYGPGTCVIVVRKADGSAVSNALLSAIKDDAKQRGPVAPADVYVISPVVQLINVSITMVGGDVATARRLISDWMSALEIGQAVNPLAFQALGFQAGAGSVSVASPTTTIIPEKWTVVGLDTLTVSLA